MASTTLTNTAISETYVSILHSKGEILPSTGQQWIYDGCGNQSSIKLGRNCNGLTVCGTLSADSIAATNWSGIINVIYPVGSVYLSVGNIAPDILFPGTTWEPISEGRYLAGVGVGIDVNNITVTLTAGNTYGEYNHTLTVNEMPAHTHGGVMRWPADGAPRTEQNQRGGPEDYVGVYRETYPTGGNQPHNNRPPGYAVYIWKRTA